MRIIYLDIDSCRPDHLGPYGYPRPTTPVIDQLARTSFIAQNCHTSDAPCLPSRAALFSGRFGINNGISCHEGPASLFRYAGRAHDHDPDRPMWMRQFQTRGWQTIGFSGFGQRHLAWWFFAGFTQNFGNQLPGGSESADQVGDLALTWLKANGTQDNWFMHVNFWDVHTPYAAPQRYWDRMKGLPTLAHPNANEVKWDAENIYGPRTARDWWLHFEDCKNPRSGRWTMMPDENILDYELFLRYTDGYDAGIAYVDDKIGQILQQLHTLGIADETAIIISADHGESVGELGMYFEHGNCAEGTTHVPLIIHWPGQTKTQTVYDGLMYQLDLPPTINELLGLDVPSGWDGMSVAEAVRGNTMPGRESLVLGTGIYSFQRAVRTPQHRMIRTLHSGLYPYEPLYLFDMQADPNQRQNLAAARPDLVQAHNHHLLEFLMRYTTGPVSVRDPFQEQLGAGLTPDIYCSRAQMDARLHQVGRADQLADLSRRRDIAPVMRPW